MPISAKPLIPQLLLAALALTAPDARAQNGVAPVTVVTAQRSPLGGELRLTATVTSERSASLSPRVSGLVAAVHVDAGDRVAAGKVLIELDPTLAQLAQQRADAALKEARAQLAEAERLHKETQALVKRRLVPETRLPAAEAERRIAAAAVDRLEAERRQQAEIVARHTVLAPFTGVVSAKHTEVGEWVETGTAVLELVDTRRLRLDVQVPQERYHDLAVGTTAKVRLDALPERALNGRVIARVPVSDPGARTFLARVQVREAEELMTPGMSAEVTFSVGGKRAQVTVPRDAVVRRPDGSTSVWIVGEGDLASVSEQIVELGRSSQNSVEVISGLKDGARVVLRGNETLKEGQRVRILQSAGARN